MGQLGALLLSLAIEVPAAVALARLARWLAPGQWRRLALTGVAATLLSHPFAWFGNRALAALLPFAPRAAVIESCVVLFEALLYWRLTPLALRRGLLVSLVANALSFGIGLLVYALLQRTS